MDEQKDPFPALGDTEVDGSENLGLNHRVAGTEEQFAQMVEMFGVLGLQKRGNLLHQHVAHAKIDAVLDKAVYELVSGVIRVSAPHSADALARRRSEEHTSELPSLLRISYAVFRLQKQISPPFSSHLRVSPLI